MDCFSEIKALDIVLIYMNNDSFYCFEYIMMQDKYDDLKVGVKSTALYFGNQTNSWLGGFATVTLSSLLLAGHMDGLGMYDY